MLFRVTTSALAAAFLLIAPAEAGSGWSSRSSGGFGVGGSRAYASGAFARSHRGYGSTYDRGGITVPGDAYDGYGYGYGGGRVVNNVTTIVGSDRGDDERRRIVPHYVPVPLPVPALSAAQEQAFGPVLYRIHKAPRAATGQSRTRAAARGDAAAWSGARIVDVHVR